MPNRKQRLEDCSFRHQRRIAALLREQDSSSSDESSNNTTTDDELQVHALDEAGENSQNDTENSDVESDVNVADSDEMHNSEDSGSNVTSHDDTDVDDSDHDNFVNSSDENHEEIPDHTSDDTSDYSSESSADDSFDDEFLDASDLSDDGNHESDDNHESSDSENEDEQGPIDEAEIDRDPPLFEGCPLTLSESLLSILALTLRHTITGVLLASILTLIHMHCPEPNYCVQSLYMFKKYFEHLKNPVERHFYCSHCLTRHQQQNQQCPDCLEHKKSSYFMTISIISQLRALYSRRGFREKLNYRQNREKLVPENIESIYDGAVYRELSGPGGFLSNPDNISFTWYTDGVQVFNSSKFSFWPLYLVINELSYEERFRKENLILAGMWFGEEKPSVNLFLHPLIEEIRQLNAGVHFEIPENENPINVKGIIICGTCDLPAKAIFLNMNQYNGKFGCHKCKQRGESINRVQVYPYRRNLTMRSEEETLRHAARVNRSPVCGVKGPTVLSFLVFMWIRTTALDAMHCVFEGVMKALMKQWFDPEFADMPFSLHRFVGLVDQRLKNLKPPGFIQRRPRSIEKHLSYWKASEFKNFFFYFSLLILEDILPRAYFEHFKLLVGAMFLLCQRSISEQMIDDASRLLHEFVSRFEVLYGLRYMSCNVHSLLHLPDLVIDLGPLWEYSCFTFEDINGKLKNLVHGSKSAELQIYNGASLYINTFTMNEDSLEEGSKPYEFCKKLLNPTKQLKLRRIGDSIYIAGGLSRLQVPDDVSAEFRRIGIRERRFIVFKRLKKNGMVFMSEIYTQAKVTNSTCAKYTVNGITHFGIIRLFVRVTDCNCRHVCPCEGVEHYAIMKNCYHENAFPDMDIPGLHFDFIRRLEINQGEVVIVDVNSLQTVCFLVTVHDRNTTFVAEPVNTVEHE